MMCEGCANAVKRVLSKTEGVESYDVDVATKKVTVRGTATPETLLERVAKTGKATALWTD